MTGAPHDAAVPASPSDEAKRVVRDRRWLWLGALLVPAVVLDQVTKHVAEGALEARATPVVVVDGFFMLFYSRNAGAFFSFGESWPEGPRTAFLVAATILAMGFIAHLYRKSEPGQGVFRAALLLFLAGALGNFIDRVLEGEVIDFLHLHYYDAVHWATFNVADVYITFGFVLLLIDSFRGPKRRASPKKALEPS